MEEGRKIPIIPNFYAAALFHEALEESHNNIL
jgi:hypothetical protein